MFRNKTCHLVKQLFNNRLDIYSGKCLRTLYSPASLGVDAYIATCERVKMQFNNSNDKFIAKMDEFVQDASTNMIFTEDLKNMVHLIEKTAENTELVVKMLKKFNSQNKELRFGNFVFGPVVMRMFTVLKDADIALKCFNDPDMEGFFDQLMSYQILLDLLFENKKYQEVLDTFDNIKARQIQGGRYPKHVVVLVFAACYKMNTPESFKYSSDLWKELNTVGHMPMRKGTTFAAALALAQNSPAAALEITSTVKQQNYITVRNIKAVALAELGRPDDAIPILKSVLEVDDPQQNKHTFFKEIVEKVREIINQSGNKEIEADFNRIEKLLLDGGHITDTKLDDFLLTEIVSTSQNGTPRDKAYLAASYNKGDRYQSSDRYNRNRDNRDNYRAERSRPGLNDLN